MRSPSFLISYLHTLGFSDLPNPDHKPCAEQPRHSGNRYHRETDFYMEPLLMVLFVHMLRAGKPKPLYIRKKDPINKEGVPRKPDKHIKIGK
jgi:hypothetical protein